MDKGEKLVLKEEVSRLKQELAAALVPRPEPRAELQAEIDAAWKMIANGWDIEPREVFEREAPTNGFKYPLAQAVHHLWKRCVRDNPPAFHVAEPRAQEPPHQRESETLSTLSLRELIDDLEPGDRARVEYEALMMLLDSTPRPHRVTPPTLRGERESVRCSGCGTRWRSPEGFILAGVVHLCGDCWRSVQPILHGKAETAVLPASAPSLEQERLGPPFNCHHEFNITAWHRHERVGTHCHKCGAFRPKEFEVAASGR